MGKDLKKVSEIMHTAKSLPLAKEKDKMNQNTLITMTKKSFGCIGVINNSKKLIIGIITDGDLRKKMNSKLLSLTASELMTKNPTTGNQEYACRRNTKYYE